MLIAACGGSFAVMPDKIIHTHDDMPSAAEATAFTCHFKCYFVLLITQMLVSMM
jgi:hypothetical protein